MQCEDKVETEHSLAKLHKVCRLIGIIVKIIFVVFCVCWLSTVLLMIYSLINPSELGERSISFCNEASEKTSADRRSLSYLCHCRCCHFWAYWISPICRIKFWIRVYRRQ